MPLSPTVISSNKKSRTCFEIIYCNENSHFGCIVQSGKPWFLAWNLYMMMCKFSKCIFSYITFVLFWNFTIIDDLTFFWRFTFLHGLDFLPILSLSHWLYDMCLSNFGVCSFVDNIEFLINFPFWSSNIPTSIAHGVCVTACSLCWSM